MELFKSSTISLLDKFELTISLPLPNDKRIALNETIDKNEGINFNEFSNGIIQ